MDGYVTLEVPVISGGRIFEVPVTSDYEHLLRTPKYQPYQMDGPWLDTGTTSPI